MVAWSTGFICRRAEFGPWHHTDPKHWREWCPHTEQGVALEHCQVGPKNKKTHQKQNVKETKTYSVPYENIYDLDILKDKNEEINANRNLQRAQSSENINPNGPTPYGEGHS